MCWVAVGAGHGGRGGRGTSVRRTGAPYGQLFDPMDRGCRGGHNSGGQGGGGGGVIFLEVTGSLQNDGEISVNGAKGGNTAGGGSGGSINMKINLIKVR